MPHNFFFAIRPDPEAAERIAELARDVRRRQGMSGQLVPRDRLHMSLNPLAWRGELSQAALARARRAAGMVRANAFVVALDRIASFRHPERPPLVLMGQDGVIGALMLYSALHEALAALGLAAGPERSIEPHVTLLRDRLAAPEAFVDPVIWRVHEFVLIDSRLGEGRHEVVGRWPLG